MIRQEGGRVSLSPAGQRAFVGWLLEQSCGYESEISETTLAKYRRIQRELGIVAGDLFESKGSQVFAHLDFESGREVLRVA